MKIEQFMTSQEFSKELDKLKAYDGGTDNQFLEFLEKSKLIVPCFRIRYPDAIARRFWKENREVAKMKQEIEPDGESWNSAVELDNLLHRNRNQIA